MMNRSGGGVVGATFQSRPGRVLKPAATRGDDCGRDATQDG